MVGSIYGQLKRMPRIDRGVKIVLDALFPTKCVLCNTIDRVGLCTNCLASVDRIHHPCFQCGADCTGPTRCGHCQAKSPDYDFIIAPFRYRPPLAGLIHRLKYQRKSLLARPLARALCREIVRCNYSRPQLLIPVPLHWSRLLWRGFNQSVELARHISLGLDIPLSRNLVCRSRRTASQAQLPFKQRRHNVRGCFELRRPLGVTSVAIVDDVVTSGETVNQMSIELKKHGVAQIQVWALLRTNM